MFGLKPKLVLILNAGRAGSNNIMFEFKAGYFSCENLCNSSNTIMFEFKVFSMTVDFFKGAGVQTLLCLNLKITIAENLKRFAEVQTLLCLNLELGSQAMKQSHRGSNTIMFEFKDATI